jgi:hypothetical protein
MLNYAKYPRYSCTDANVSVVDCTVAPWDPWSECDTECGTGTMKRDRRVIRQPENGGRHCPTLTQHRGCQGTKCNVNGRRPIKGE